MAYVWLNGAFIPAAEARISPMDRGFLFGDGIYEVIPAYQGRMVGFSAHIARLQRGLAEIGIVLDWSPAQWHKLCSELLARNCQKSGDQNGGDQNSGGAAGSDGKSGTGIYLHVSRGTDSKRGHAFPAGITPTVFAYTFAIATPPDGSPGSARPFQVATATDLRWKRCHIKSTALLGNVLHHQQGVAAGCQEILLFNEHNELTEGSSCNALIVKNGVIATPPLDWQILPGITRQILLQILRRHSMLTVEERVISKAEVLAADEVWLSSSSKEIVPVLAIDGVPVGHGDSRGIVGPVWHQAQQLFSRFKFEE